MNQAWVDAKKQESAQKVESLFTELRGNFERCGLFTEAEVSALIERMKRGPIPMGVTFYEILAECTVDRRKSMEDSKRQSWVDDVFDFIHTQNDLIVGIIFEQRANYSVFLDSEPVHFDGDIIITDPGYMMMDDDGWSRCDCGRKLDVLGFTRYLTHNTICGDWSCTTYNTDTGEPMGTFCTIAGTVSIMLLDESVRYNPHYWYDIVYHPHALTIIRDFCGMVQIVVKEEDGNPCVEVVGNGINRVTGEPINFRSRQTGF